MNKAEFKCPVCSDLKQVNFNEKKIANLKSSAHSLKFQRDFISGQLKGLYQEKNKIEKDIRELNKIYAKLKQKVFRAARIVKRLQASAKICL